MANPIQDRPKRNIPGWVGPYASLAPSGSPDTLFLFVHGLSGNTVSTWLGFPEMTVAHAAAYPKLAAGDMVYYYYESISTPIRENANTLEKFVNEVLTTNAVRAGASGTNRYANLVLIGHSEGGVLIRRMILNRLNAIRSAAAKQSTAGGNQAADIIRTAAANDPILNAKVRLFAPAHLGTNFSTGIGAILDLVDILLAVAKKKLVANELLPNSPIISAVQQGIIEAYREFPGIPALAARVLFAIPDGIVHDQGYERCDTVESVDRAEKRNHVSVCKPDDNYLRPLEFVLS